MAAPASSRMPHVALLIESSRAYGRGLIRGVAQYIQEHGPWSIYFRQQGLDQAPPAWLRRWRGDGILARIDNQRMADAVIKTSVPAVDVRGAIPGLPVPFVGLNNQMVVDLAINHFVERGFRRFGFCASARGLNRFLDLRCELFEKRILAMGHTCSVFRPSPQLSGMWEKEQEHIARWLNKLEKPVAIMTGSDERGLQLLDACQRAGLAVPSAVSVLSVDNDECICRLTRPPLTSIDVNPERIGYEAAALLDRMIKHQARPPRTIEIEPRGVVCRQSSDDLAIDDQEVAEAVRYIREHACDGIGVEAVLQQMATSRSTLERRFKHWIGRTPKAELLRVQLSRAKELLAHTNMPITAIADKSGFRSLSYFAEAFHRKVGLTPRAYRQKYRAH